MSILVSKIYYVQIIVFVQATVDEYSIQLPLMNNDCLVPVDDVIITCIQVRITKSLGTNNYTYMVNLKLIW